MSQGTNIPGRPTSACSRLVEIQENHVNIGNCIGPQIEPPIYRYRFENGVLSLNPGNIDLSTRTLENGLGFIGHSAISRYENPNDPWCTKNCGDVWTDLYLIDSLPYMPTISSFPQVTIHSIQSNGEIIIEIEQSIYLIEPGQSWYKLVDKTFETDPTSQTACSRYVSNYQLTNQGFFDVNDIIWQK